MKNKKGFTIIDNDIFPMSYKVCEYFVDAYTEYVVNIMNKGILYNLYVRKARLSGKENICDVQRKRPNPPETPYILMTI